MDSKRKWILVQRYVTGNADPTEKALVERWIDRHPENKKIVNEITEIWKLSTQENFEVNVEAAWKKFQKKHQSPRKKANVYSVPVRPKKWDYLIRVAAVLVIAAFAGLFVNYLSQTQTDPASSADKSEFYTMKKLETDRGEKARVRFSDGTEVMLNSASTLQFPEEFTGTNREVYLDGEAHFKVAYNEGHPFIVHSQDAVIQVLGTEFNVRGWSDDANVDIVVSEGKVSVNNSDPDRVIENVVEVILEEGQKTSVRRGQNPTPAHRVDTTYHMLWTSGGMHFDNNELSYVLKNIERRFNVNISVKDTGLLEVPFTGTFQYAELDEVLSVIAASMEVGYTREGMNVIIE